MASKLTARAGKVPIAQAILFKATADTKIHDLRFTNTNAASKIVTVYYRASGKIPVQIDRYILQQYERGEPFYQSERVMRQGDAIEAATDTAGAIEWSVEEAD